MRLPGELEVLLLRGLSKASLEAACRLAPEHGWTPSEYLVRKRIVSLETLYSAFAEYCGVPFLPYKSFRPRTLNNHVLQMGEGDRGPLLVSLYKNKAYYAIAPAIDQFEEVRTHLLKNPEFASRIRIASPSSLNHANRIQSAPSGDLLSRFPEMSAKQRLSRGQAALVLVALAGLVLGLATTPMFWVYLAGGLFGTACALSGWARVQAAVSTWDDPLAIAFPERLYASDIIWPRYTVLVPLHEESRVVPDLVAHLGALDYHRRRLQILFLVEQEDEATYRAFPETLPAHMELIRVPKGLPQTKPRALCYGLALANGDLVTVYDAEDRPDPEQLRKAALMFALLPKEVACLQARLTIDNPDEGFFARQFSIEYACLFDQLLPWCYRNNWPFPLGGTSNHFRREALDAVGAWDAYNVTEDADLGVRLARFGFRSGVLASSTYEEAPTHRKAWLAQRARWYKGWVQTFCVHMRDPGVMLRQIGTRRAVAMAAIFIASVAMIVLHPVFMSAFLIFMGLVSVDLASFRELSLPAVLLMIAGGAGYGGAIAASVAASVKRFGRLDLASAALIPVYWMFSGFAFYMAVLEFIWRPHHWSKTEHGIARRRSRTRQK
ncbi:glycosyltransferase [Roseibium sp. RKSG952]|uniref:glycosyltransferase n=1 Tax=Roseibium sp. RKSG952 TaxID=2529384 RepID=UPI0012BB7212|nr:glycosyltransferase [Roseibium sp. RKSG952]MTH95962.1 glycosyltransferase [Roseibium sp. RKSG952]